MQINDIKALVARLEAIVEGWDEKSGAPAVERHIAASLLAELYEAVKFDTALAATPIAKVEEPAPIMTEEVAEPEEESAPEVIDLSDIFGSSFDVPEEVAEPTEEPIEEKVEEEPIEESVPAIEEEILVVEEEPAPEEPIAEVEVEQTEEVEPTDEQPIEEVAEVEQPAEETVELPTATEEQPAEEIAEQPATTDEEKPAEEERSKSEQASLFDMDIVRRPRSSSGRRVIMSLYGESPATSRREKKAKSAEPIPSPEQKNEQKPEQEPTPAQPITEPTSAPAPEVTETPIAVSVAERIAAAQADGPQVLGDVIGAGTTTLAEAVAASQPTVQTVQNDRVNSLRNSIGINDRFIMIRDLFGGDGAAFDRAMEELDAFEDFNECLVYMSEYRWNPNSDGARMLMDLVTRKLL